MIHSLLEPTLVPLRYLSRTFLFACLYRSLLSDIYYLPSVSTIEFLRKFCVLNRSFLSRGDMFRQVSLINSRTLVRRTNSTIPLLPDYAIHKNSRITSTAPLYLAQSPFFHNS